MLFLDGAYTVRGNRATFHRAPPATGEELTGLLDTLSRRIVRAMERCGLLIADPVHPHLDYEPGSSLDHVQAASTNYCIALGPHAGRKVLTLYRVPPLEETQAIPLLARRGWLLLSPGSGWCAALLLTAVVNIPRFRFRNPMTPVDCACLWRGCP